MASTVEELTQLLSQFQDRAYEDERFLMHARNDLFESTEELRALLESARIGRDVQNALVSATDVTNNAITLIEQLSESMRLYADRIERG